VPHRAVIYFFLGFLGGVIGLPEPMPPYTYFCFFSAGLRIWWGGKKSALQPRQREAAGNYLERAEETLVDAHHRTSVVKLSAVVGGREKRDQLPFREELVTVLHDLMRTADKIHVVLLQEPGNHVRTEGERDTTVVFAPSGDIFIGIRPEKIAEKTAVGDLKNQSAHKGHIFRITNSHQ
jgi:hypothetical protein